MPKSVEITAVVPERKDAKTGEIKQAQLGPCTVSVDFGETANESVEMFGDEAVNSNALRNWTVILQANIRSALKRGEKPEDIVARLKGAKMGVATQAGKVDVEAAFRQKFLSATPEEREEMLAKLKAKVA